MCICNLRRQAYSYSRHILQVQRVGGGGGGGGGWGVEAASSHIINCTFDGVMHRWSIGDCANLYLS